MFNSVAPRLDFMTEGGSSSYRQQRGWQDYDLLLYLIFTILFAGFKKKKKKDGSEAIIHFIHDCLYVNTGQLLTARSNVMRIKMAHAKNNNDINCPL